MLDLKTYLRALGSDVARDSFAAMCETSAGHLRNVSYGQKKANAELCGRIELHSAGSVRCESVRPDLPWSRIKDKEWPNPAGRPVVEVARAAT